jgi:hypothetical protein
MGIISGYAWGQMRDFLMEEGWEFAQIAKVMDALEVAGVEIVGPIPPIEEEEPDDPPAVGDCPNEYAWSERPELHTIDEQEKEDGNQSL